MAELTRSLKGVMWPMNCSSLCYQSYRDISSCNIFSTNYPASMTRLLISMWLVGQASSLTFNVPATPPSNASGQLSAAPVGVS